MASDASTPTSIIVGGLPADMELSKVRRVFAAYGTIAECRLLSPENEKSSALIRLSSHKEAGWIVENLDRNIPEGLLDPVTIRYASGGRRKAHGRGSNPSRGGPYEGGKYTWWDDSRGGASCSIEILHDGLRQAGVLPGGDGWPNNDGTLYVAGLPHDTTNYDLYKIFGTFGAIPHKGVTALMHDDGTCRGIGFVSYINRQDAQKAIDVLHGTLMPDGRALTVSVKKTRDYERS